MTELVSRRHALFALFAGLTGVGGSFALTGYTRQFIVAPIDAVVVRLTPGPIVAWMIENVGEEAHLIHIGLSFFVAAGLLVGSALVGLLVARRLDRSLVGAGLAGFLAWSLTAGITGEPLLALGPALPVTVFTAVGATPFASPEQDPSRRRLLRSGVGALALIGVSAGVGQWVTGSDSTDTESDADLPEPVRQRLEQAEDQSLDVESDDLVGLVSSIEEFYNVDINEFDPDLERAGWSLTLSGTVEQDVQVSYEELTNRPVERRYVTIRCVGDKLNGGQMDTAIWTGTPIKPLLEEADPSGGCNCAMLRAEDGYSVQFPLEALEDAFLAWEMNGQPLPQSHGRPVRILVPGHWGETNVKWLDEIELLEEEMDGYWEQRGWQGTGPVNTVAKLWSQTRLDDGRIELAGHAYAGTRGIQRVEVSTDGGATWNDAELSAPLPGADVWRQWRYVFEAAEPREVVLRATDGEGELQERESSESFPSGATGWVTESVNL
jgi:DMSO/TMAO reductase YedYZ molybdopterin-dependent catalytic subunit